jgi:hypothetical protein
VEESTLAERDGGKLLPQDAFIRANIRPEDVLVVSVGGNDIALRPSAATIAAMGWLVFASSDAAIDAGTALGLGHFERMFRDDVAAYIEQLTARVKPRLVIACMVYFPHEQRGDSWAEAALSALRYNDNPARVQRIMRRVYAQGTCKVAVPHVPVVPLALFDVLDSSPASHDYVARVEPSETGGRKMAAAIWRLVSEHYGKATAPADGPGSLAAFRAAGGAGDATTAGY